MAATWSSLLSYASHRFVKALTRSATCSLASSMMRLQAAPPTSALSALAAHSPRSAGVAASAGSASSRATQRSSPPDPRAAMLFPSALGSDATPTGVMTLAPTGADTLCPCLYHGVTSHVPSGGNRLAILTGNHAGIFSSGCQHGSDNRELLT